MPSLMDAMDVDPTWTEVTHCPPALPLTGTPVGSGFPQAAPRMGMDPALGQPGCLDTAPVNSHQLWPLPCPHSVPVSAHPSPVPLPPLTLEPHPHSGREGGGHCSLCFMGCYLS